MELPSATGSEYEHHNIAKYLMCIAPNSGFNFVSKAFTGRISDGKLTLKSGLLDMLPLHCSIIADQGFNLFDEFAARNLYFILILGQRGTTDGPC